MNILNAQEAFAAMMAGRKVICRAMGELSEFDDLDQFPATIFTKPNCEFYIKIETIEVAGVTFEKPLTLDDVQLGDDVYIIQASGEIHHYKYAVCHEVLNQSIARGFAQRDQNNAQLQAEAFCKLFDRVYRQAEIVEVSTQTKQKRRSRKTEEPAANDQNSSSNDVEEKTFESQANIQIEQVSVTSVEDPLSEDFNHEHQNHLNEILNDIALAKTPAEANGHLNYTKSWTAEQRKPVIQAINKRLVELNPIADVKIEEAPSLMVQIQNAADLTTLDMLEIDVGGRHPDIQPKLMGCVKKRRFELENGISTVEASV